jgi:hypothetical protein
MAMPRKTATQKARRRSGGKNAVARCSPIGRARYNRLPTSVGGLLDSRGPGRSGALTFLFAGRYEEALDWAEQAASLPNCQYWTHAHRVVALCRLGRHDEMAAAARTLVAQCPEFSVEFARKRLFYLKRPEQLELYLGALAEAGFAAS